MPDPNDPMSQVLQTLGEFGARIRRLESLPVFRTWIAIEDKLLAADAPNIEFVNIPQTFRHLRTISALRSDRAAFGESIFMRMNGDTGPNYWSLQVRIFNPGILVTSERIADTVLSVLSAVGDTSASGVFRPSDLFISNYTIVGQAKSMFGYSGSMGDSAAGETQLVIATGTWRAGASTPAITSMLFYPGAGGTVWKAGSRITLYGLG